MTIWGVVGVWLGMAAYIVAWFRGGHPERFAASVMLLHFVFAALSFILRLEFAGIHLPRLIVDSVRLLIFIWLCLRSDRWWPLLMTGTMVLMAMVDIVAFLEPDLSHWGAASAKVGLGYLMDLTLMLSVAERWLAGEAPAARAAWAASDIATAARRRRKESARRSKQCPMTAEPHEPDNPGPPRRAVHA